MSKKMIEVVVVRKLIPLLQRGLSERNIAEEFGISGATVRRYLQSIPNEVNLDGLLQLEDEALAALVYPAEKEEGEYPRLKDFESRKDYFLRQLPRTGMNRQLLWLEYNPADMMQVNFTGELLFYFDSSGRQIFCPVFVLVWLRKLTATLSNGEFSTVMEQLSFATTHSKGYSGRIVQFAKKARKRAAAKLPANVTDPTRLKVIQPALFNNPNEQAI